MAGIVACLFAPKLYRIYSRASMESQLYTGNFLEQCGDFGVTFLFPAGVVYTCCWQRKLNLLLYLSVFVFSSYALRAVGRAFNPTYKTFLQTLNRATREPNTENMEMIRKYDFHFSGWPKEYQATKLGRIARQANLPHPQQGAQAIKKFTPCWLASWVVAHSFGIYMIYPGTLLQYVINSYLSEARGKLVTEDKGVRTRVDAADGNRIDTILFDRRREVNTNGKMLVICCEGNAGFYEVGMVGTPLAKGYSVLGWNHPGFGGSSGTPYPENELNAAEAVFEYATKGLGFREDEIILYGWSIGGFPAAYLAAQYPNVKGLILDATFDDILPLAIPRMPAFMESLVHATIRYHVDLRVNKELSEYKGPLRLIRRTDDEIIADPPQAVPGNRGNFLLIDVMRQRYPVLMDHPEAEAGLKEWLNQAHVAPDPGSIPKTDLSPVGMPGNPEVLPTPDKIALTIKIAERILTDYKASHCTPLPENLFHLPWEGTERRKY